jgi:uncharacterized protein
MGAEFHGDIDLDRGPRASARERLCAVTRTVRPVSDLIRFVVGPDGEVVPDLKRKLPGRGVWITATCDALAEAVKRSAFARGFKRNVRLPTDLPARTDRLIETTVLDALAMAGKAGLVVTGFAKTEAALAQRDVVALLHAAEAAADGMRKLNAAARRARSGASPLMVIGNFTLGQLDLVLGRPNVVHAALLAGPASDTFLARLRRLERFRATDRDNEAGRAVDAGPRLDMDAYDRDDQEQ